MNPAQTSLEDILRHCWDRLQAAAAGEPGNPLRRAVLGTRAADGVAMRTVVVRTVDPAARRITCNTDRRTAKARELAVAPRIAWLFFDPAAQTQIRLQGSARLLLARGDTERYWKALAPSSYPSFATARAPSTPVPGWTTDLEPHLLGPDAVVSDADAAWARSNFAVVETTVDTLDWVRLDPDGNARARFRWSDGRWQGSWVVP